MLVFKLAVELHKGVLWLLLLYKTNMCAYIYIFFTFFSAGPITHPCGAPQWKTLMNVECLGQRKPLQRLIRLFIMHRCESQATMYCNGKLPWWCHTFYLHTLSEAFSNDWTIGVDYMQIQWYKSEQKKTILDEILTNSTLRQYSKVQMKCRLEGWSLQTWENEWNSYKSCCFC